MESHKTCSKPPTRHLIYDLLTTGILLVVDYVAGWKMPGHYMEVSFAGKIPVHGVDYGEIIVCDIAFDRNSTSDNLLITCNYLIIWSVQ